MKEVWKSIPGFEGLYDVSNLGRVRSLNRIVKTGRYRRGVRVFPGRILKHTVGIDGYPMVNLGRGVFKRFAVHRLVAQTFIGPIPNGKEVNHKDMNRGNPAMRNLEYVTHSENMRHSIQNGGGPPSRMVRRLADGKIFPSISSAARNVDGTAIHVLDVCLGRRKRHKGHKFEFLAKTKHKSLIGCPYPGNDCMCEDLARVWRDLNS